MNVKKISNPAPRFKLFEPTPEKVLHLSKIMMQTPLLLSDEYRQWPVIHGMINRYFAGNGINLIYEIDKFEGVFGFLDLVFNWRCHLFPKIWVPEIFSHGLMRQAEDVISLIMDTFNLKRVSAETADERMVKAAQLIGFVEEGRQPKAFLWDGKFYDKVLLSYIREGEYEFSEHNTGQSYRVPEPTIARSASV